MNKYVIEYARITAHGLTRHTKEVLAVNWPVAWDCVIDEVKREGLKVVSRAPSSPTSKSVKVEKIRVTMTSVF